MDRREDVEPNPPPARSTSPAPTTPTAAPGQQVPTRSTRATTTATATSWKSPRRATRPPPSSPGTCCWSAATRPRTTPTYFSGFPADQVSADLLPGQRGLRLGRQPVDLHRRRRPEHPRNDGLFKVTLDGAERGKVEQFLAVPRRRRNLRPDHPRRRALVFVAVQHPGEDGSLRRAALLLPGLRPGRPPPKRGDAASRVRPWSRSSAATAEALTLPPGLRQSNAGSDRAHVGARDGRDLTPRCFWRRGSAGVWPN